MRDYMQRGGVVVLALVLMLGAALVLSASLGIIGRQSHQVTSQEETEKAFNLADSGVYYTQWLLGYWQDGFSPVDLKTNPPSGVINHVVENDSGQVVGTFTVEFLDASDQSLTIRSTGQDAALPDVCQVVTAEFQKDSDGIFRLTTWNHEVNHQCMETVEGCITYPISRGSTVNGQLSDTDCDKQYALADSKADFYTLAGMAGSALQINLTSDIFSPYLSLVAPSGGVTRTDACTATGLGACIADNGWGIMLTETGTYKIEVASNQEGGLGAYTLKLPTQCSDGIDNDGDLAIDFLVDFSCDSSQDDDETNPKSACQDELDNDGDETIDMNDPGCDSRQDNSEKGDTLCDNNRDDDGDGSTDYPDDTDCASPSGNSEASTVTYQCSDGQDNDNDGAMDYKADGTGDFSCTSLTDDDETNPKSACQDELDNDGDETIDMNDPGCDSRQDNSEKGYLVCDNNEDDDNDRSTDYQVSGGDPGCSSVMDTSEMGSNACDDGLDNDDDGKVDADDRGCWSDPLNSTTYSYLTDTSEKGYLLCDNGKDDDYDGKTDYNKVNGVGDQQCFGPEDDSEASDNQQQCSDGQDNDGDTLTDYKITGGDPGCANGSDNDETDGTVPCDNGSIYYNQTKVGRLEATDCYASDAPDRRYADLWSFTGQVGDLIQIELKPDNTIDWANVYLKDSSEMILVESNNCGSGYGSACIPSSSQYVTYSLPSSGSFTIVATSVNPGAMFGYTLHLLKSAVVSSIGP